MSNGTSSGRAPSVDRLRGSVDDWLSGLGTAQEIGRLLARPPKEQQARGYAHTLREIAQQPVTWLGTAAAVASDRVRLDEVLERAGIHACTGSLVLTGSGSSLYAGECLALPRPGPTSWSPSPAPATAPRAGRSSTRSSPATCAAGTSSSPATARAPWRRPPRATRGWTRWCSTSRPRTRAW